MYNSAFVYVVMLSNIMANAVQVLITSKQNELKGATKQTKREKKTE